MARPDFTKKWASSRPSIPEIASPDYAQGFANYLGAIPPSTDDHDYIMNLQDERAVWLDENKAPLASPAFTGTPTAPTAAPGTSNTQVATTAFVALAGNLLNTTRIDVASAATVNLTSSAPNTRHINITGTTSITAFTVAAGQTYFVRFAGALTLTNNAGIVTQSGANITTAAGDTCILRATAQNVVEVLAYTPVLNKSVGYGQTWQDVTGSRGVSTNYTNTTGKPIEVSVSFSYAGQGTSYIVVDGVVVNSFTYSLGGTGATMSAIVPDGSVYSAVGAKVRWTELR